MNDILSRILDEPFEYISLGVNVSANPTEDP